MRWLGREVNINMLLGFCPLSQVKREVGALPMPQRSGVAQTLIHCLGDQFSPVAQMSTPRDSLLIHQAKSQTL